MYEQEEQPKASKRKHDTEGQETGSLAQGTLDGIRLSMVIVLIMRVQWHVHRVIIRLRELLAPIVVSLAPAADSCRRPAIVTGRLNQLPRVWRGLPLHCSVLTRRAKDEKEGHVLGRAPWIFIFCDIPTLVDCATTNRTDRDIS